jgi:5-methylcytosine-specific restriction endonuclease McrA
MSYDAAYQREYRRKNRKRIIALIMRWNKTPKGVANRKRWLNRNPRKHTEASNSSARKYRLTDKGRRSQSEGYKRRRMRLANVVGTHTQLQWEELKRMHAYLCHACGDSEPQIKLTEDHIIPITKGGTHDIANIQPLCNSCNSRKGTKLIDDLWESTH